MQCPTPPFKRANTRGAFLLLPGECFLFLHTLDLGREARDHSIYIWRGRDAPEVCTPGYAR